VSLAADAEEPGRAPVPQGRYRAAVVAADFVFTAGVTPRRDGVLVETGVVGDDISIERARELVALATHGAVKAARAALAQAEPARRLARCARAVVLLRTSPDFTEHAWVADAATAVVAEELRDEAVGARTAYGVASLPGGAPCEVELTFQHGPA